MKALSRGIHLKLFLCSFHRNRWIKRVGDEREEREAVKKKKKGTLEKRTSGVNICIGIHRQRGRSKLTPNIMTAQWNGKRRQKIKQFAPKSV